MPREQCPSSVHRRARHGARERRRQTRPAPAQRHQESRGSAARGTRAALQARGRHCDRGRLDQGVARGGLHVRDPAELELLEEFLQEAADSGPEVQPRVAQAEEKLQQNPLMNSIMKRSAGPPQGSRTARERHWPRPAQRELQAAHPLCECRARRRRALSACSDVILRGSRDCSRTTALSSARERPR